jgi:hypothetical protein
MDELTGRPEVLFRRNTAAFEPKSGLAALDEALNRDDMKVLIAQLGQEAVETAPFFILVKSQARSRAVLPRLEGR